MDRLLRGASQLGLELDASQLDRFERFYCEMVDWNRRINLTSVTEYEEVQTRHFLDSLTVAAAIPSGILRGARLLDVGSGAGLPGVPLAIARPGLSVTLLEATRKKAAFLEHLVGELGLDTTDVLAGRAEILARDPALRERFDVVASRAVARLPVLAELTLPFCRVGGIVVAQKARGATTEIEDAEDAIGRLGGRLREAMPVTVPGSNVRRLLVTIDKRAPTPDRYPRRPGIPSKRPL